ncbi:hypothetical protein P691DRAFT_787315 [Macrolepiota fuliginosa MF-IS2]|uniref:Nephrocystin 3-like N-terminal domain-containing protein n=1 Tax=Macrolepiota fuliginosa MF-IS2 TaxID=1400762 RepID=A0A9P6BZU6_9AGAR|nr:hypothetical protein P691DRAFT_787315 [Macrolepiota fuliginosa MF-IS2]
MPFLETFKARIARFSGRKQQGEEGVPIPDLGQPTATANPAQQLPTPAPPTHVHSSNATHDDQATNSGITVSAADFLPNAHNFPINQLSAISNNIQSGTTVLQHLMEKGMPAAIHDSSDRNYPPRCHPSTRKSLKERVTKWGMGDGSDRRMLWLLGFAAVGKSAIAQTIAEEFQEAGRLGASFFFSRPNHLNDPDAVIPTLVYQLAIKVPGYKNIITRRLADDPRILKKNRHKQFWELIIEPFHILMTQYPHTVPQPLLIILDGLDECEDRQAQCEFIDMISTHVHRPEWHLESMISDPDYHVVCKREKLDVYDEEAQEDVRRLLEAEFDKIQKRYRARLPDGWPPEECFDRIVRAASGHLGLASFVLRFIGDKGYGDPDGRLKVCMKFLYGGGALDGINPLHALDLLYLQILSGIPADDLPTTMRILGILFAYDVLAPPANGVAEFLDLDPGQFHHLLERLHSVLYVPPADGADTHISFYHASFSDFLEDPVRSGRFWLDWKAVYHDIAFQHVHWLESPPTHKLNARFFWIGWCAFRRVPDESIPSLISRLEHIDFSRLPSSHLGGIGHLLLWLHSLGSSRNKSLIAVVGEASEPLRQASYCCSFPDCDITSLIPEGQMPKSPFTVNLRLGKVTPVYIALEVNDVPGMELAYLSKLPSPNSCATPFSNSPPTAHSVAAK